MSIEALAETLRAHPSIQSKLAISGATAALGLLASGPGTPGDDAAPLPREGGYDLLAGEGFIPAFVQDDPWFAGWCAVMVNLSDIAAMGGHAVALLDQVWAPDAGAAAPLLQGLRDASQSYGVPLVGGHTNLSAPELGIAASVFGRATRLITSFDARPGDTLVAAIDHRGTYRNYDNFCAALDAPADRLRRDLALLPELAEAELVTAGKDISQAGLIGTALMLAECSGTGMKIDLDAITPPPGVPQDRWLRSFPSYGFLLSVDRQWVNAVCGRFAARGIDASTIGRVTQGSAVTISQSGASALFWDHAHTPYMNLGAQDA